MLFNSFTFLLFFIVVYSVYLFLPHKKQNIWLLIASIVFYGFWSWKFIFLLLFTSTVDYWAGFKIYNSADPVFRKRILTVSIAANLVILGFFKYFNFFISEANSLLHLFNIHINTHSLNIILPLGLSFYTFQSISYAWEIYRGENKPIDSITDYWLFVSFFPHMIAGPIQKGKILIPQIINKRIINLDKFYEGSYLVFFGLFKKVAIADQLAPHVNKLFSMPLGSYTWVDVVMGVWMFAFQIYADFSGYTDMARGLAKMMGFEFSLNFNLPYFSKSPSEFWKRWHISLSTWLSDFLYKPLGGSRKGRLITYRNLMITMVLGGLWHGASNHFILWGFYQGSLLIIHKAWHEYMSRYSLYKSVAATKLYGVVSIIVTFIMTCYGWLIFRASSVGQVWDMTITVINGVGAIGSEFLYPAMLFNVIWLLFLVQLLQYIKKDLMFVYKLNKYWLLKSVYYFVVLYILIKGEANGNEFIYFQF